MVIDTGDHQPICVGNSQYGVYEEELMQKHVDDLIKKELIRPDMTSPWGFHCTLAPKPHQEHITKIDDYIWRFCINYIKLNQITCPAEYPIPRCDDTVIYGFGDAEYFILMDAYSGYHQVKLAEESAQKTAFFAPGAWKYIWVVMPFGLRNTSGVFTQMMYNLKVCVGKTSKCMA